MHQISAKSDEAVVGSTLLLSALLLKAKCDEEADWEVVAVSNPDLRVY